MMKSWITSDAENSGYFPVAAMDAQDGVVNLFDANHLKCNGGGSGIRPHLNGILQNGEMGIDAEGSGANGSEILGLASTTSEEDAQLLLNGSDDSYQLADVVQYEIIGDVHESIPFTAEATVVPSELAEVNVRGSTSLVPGTSVPQRDYVADVAVEGRPLTPRTFVPQQDYDADVAIEGRPLTPRTFVAQYDYFEENAAHSTPLVDETAAGAQVCEETDESVVRALADEYANADTTATGDCASCFHQPMDTIETVLETNEGAGISEEAPVGQATLSRHDQISEARTTEPAPTGVEELENEGCDEKKPLVKKEEREPIDEEFDDKVGIKRSMDPMEPRNVGLKRPKTESPNTEASDVPTPTNGTGSADQSSTTQAVASGNADRATVREMLLKSLTKLLVKWNPLATFSESDAISSQLESTREQLRKTRQEVEDVSRSLEKVRRDLNARNSGFVPAVGMTRSVSMNVKAVAIRYAVESALSGSSTFKVLTPKRYDPSVPQTAAVPAPAFTAEVESQTAILPHADEPTPEPRRSDSSAAARHPELAMVNGFADEVDSNCDASAADEAARTSAGTGRRSASSSRSGDPLATDARPASGRGNGSVALSCARNNMALVERKPAGPVMRFQRITPEEQCALPPFPQQNVESSSVPKPFLRLGNTTDGRLTLTWSLQDVYGAFDWKDIAHYEVYTHIPSSGPKWYRLDKVESKPLPIVCTLSKHDGKETFFFAVRAYQCVNSLDPSTVVGRFSNTVSTLASTWRASNKNAGKS